MNEKHKTIITPASSSAWISMFSSAALTLMLDLSSRWHKLARLQLCVKNCWVYSYAVVFKSIRFAVSRPFSCFYLQTSNINVERQSRMERFQNLLCCCSTAHVWVCAAQLCIGDARKRPRTGNGQKHTDTEFVPLCVCLEGSKLKVSNTQNIRVFSQTDPPPLSLCI